jgi:hypothetical protein
MRNSRGIIFLIIVIIAGFFLVFRYFDERALSRIIARLEADTRVAEVLVTGVNYDETLKKNLTTIKFLEYDSQRRPLAPKYFTFPGNIIQFQSLVVRFDDRFVTAGDRLRGRSVYLFWKAFMLDGAQTKEFPITNAQEIPQGYKVEGEGSSFEKQFWQRFWRYALDRTEASKAGIKNAQIEAPGTTFVPGYLYTIKIEHDGGLRIDTSALPEILQGETILP